MSLRRILLLSFSIIKALVATRPPPHVINEKKDDGFTALHLAVVNEYLEVVELLIHEVITYSQTTQELELPSFL